MREDGFTLVEALVALVLGAMVLGAVLSTVKIASLGAARARTASMEAEAFARAGTVLAGDAAHALFLGDDEGRPLFEGRPDSLMLPEQPRNLGAPGLPAPPVAVIYRLQSRPAGGLLTRAEAPIAGRQAGAAGPAVPIWQAATRLEFRYLDDSGTWLADWTDRHRLPRAFALADPGEGRPELVAALPALLPMACASGPGPACPLPMEQFP